jgi:parvulin-like peptidyl-prolyl isomerase
MTHPGAYHKHLQRARQKRTQQAKQRRLQRERQQLQREQAQAQRALQALEEAIAVLELPETIAEEVQWRLQAQQRLLGKIFGMRFPPGVWVPPLPRAVPRATLGQERAGPHLGGLAQAEVGQAPAAPGPGSVGSAVARSCGQEPSHPQSVAVDMGGG